MLKNLQELVALEQREVSGGGATAIQTFNQTSQRPRGLPLCTGCIHGVSGATVTARYGRNAILFLMRRFRRIWE